MFVADECCADGEEGFMDVVAAIEASIGVQPRDVARHYPAFAEAGPVGAAFGDPGCDATIPRSLR